MGLPTGDDEKTIPTVPEPYVPYIPSKWNGTLVLAEAQNHSKGSTYTEWLRSLSSEARMQRLGRGNRIGVRPWDDGSLKLAVEVAFGIEADRTGVSNGVLWSLVDDKGNNRNPTLELIRKSQAVWTEMLGVLKPECIVAAGSVARRVVEAALKGGRQEAIMNAWPLPSPRVLSPISGTLDEKEWLRRFPEVAHGIAKRPDWVDGPLRKNRILYACLAVARSKSRSGLRRNESV